jgi:hypothetical protein
VDIELYAATLEAQQADRDYREAYRAFDKAGMVWASEQDYAVWSLAAYANTAEAAVYRMAMDA